MNESLESVKWGEFAIGEIFTITNSKPYHKNNLKLGKGKTPYVTRSSFNNGLEYIVENENFTLNPKDTISLGAENADFFYQGIEYITGNKMYCLSNGKINRYTGLFLTQALKKSIENCGFGYGIGLTGTRLCNRKVLLPKDSNGNPHWEFMESFMRELEKKHLEKIIAYYKNKLVESIGGGGEIPPFLAKKYCYSSQDKNISNSAAFANFIEGSLMEIAKNELTLESIKWGEFYFYEIFHKIKRGKRLIKKHQIEGKIPYISSSAINNGVDNFISNDKRVRKFQNCISLANSGSVGSAFFHQYEFIGSDHITALENKKFNLYIYLFMLPLIKRLSEKYSFNREINDSRIKREKLILPIDSKGKPNYKFMESFMRELEKKQLCRILKFYQHKFVA
ncbi:restriction endonuclease subunit S [Helicobacter sp. UBA3407]|uniref:restriction endonuclease subunit S n=1 Tax=Helicobacter sp. UBA3407 TaxID=1946588 RepID=UPI002636692E|nr:restriction endonuclease subunit S [Helicobacter sp. UBA3407]